MPRMSDAELNAHNNRVAAELLAEREYVRSLTMEQMIREMEEAPSYRKFQLFDQEFRETMDAQMHISGADSVAANWAKMKAAYDKWLSSASL